MSELADDFAEMIELMPGDLRADVERELRMGFQLEVALAEERQKKLAIFNHRHPRRALEGMGQTVMSIDPVFRKLAERTYGPGCWEDKGFRREALRDNPMLRVPYQARGVALRVDGRRDLNRRTQRGTKETKVQASALNPSPAQPENERTIIVP